MQNELPISVRKMLTFNDSLQLVGASLEQIDKKLCLSGIEKFTDLRPEFPGATPDEHDLLLRKQVYPEDDMD